MDIKNISLPEIYKESADFRFFCKWFEEALCRIQYDTENFFDLYDPLKCPEDLLWALAQTMGYKYDDRLPTAFNRLVLLYFMSMIRNRGSKDGVTLAAETNLAQFPILMKAQGYTDENGEEHLGKEILYNRLEDTSIPVNSVYVTPHTEQGYIDVVYFSTKVPLDACIEYVRPLGMFLFQSAGVRFDTRTKITVDARLTHTAELGVSIGPTHVGHYRREDYARLQRARAEDITSVGNEIPGISYSMQGHDIEVDSTHTRKPVWYRNSDYEDMSYGDGTYGGGAGEYPNGDGPGCDPGYRTLFSLQLSNNEEIVKALIDPIFSLGYQPQTIDVQMPINYLNEPYRSTDVPQVNLRYDKHQDELNTEGRTLDTYDVTTIDPARSADVINPRPAVNPVMSTLGDSLSLNDVNTSYTKASEDTVHVQTVLDDKNNTLVDSES